MEHKTTLYLVRHCEADGNKNRVFHGHFDSDITENGKAQLLLLAKRFEDIDFDAVYSSDLKRAYLTAQAVNSVRKLPVTEVEKLREIYGGEWENIEFAEIAKNYPEEFKLWSQGLECFCMPGGESYREFYERITTGINDIIGQNKGKTIVIATHGTVIKLYLSYAAGYGLAGSEKIPWCDNTAVAKIEYDSSFKPEIIFMNDNSHLTEDVQTLISQKWWREYVAKLQGGKTE